MAETHDHTPTTVHCAACEAQEPTVTSRRTWAGTFAPARYTTERTVAGPVLVEVVVFDHGSRWRDGRWVRIQGSYRTFIDGQSRGAGFAGHLDADGLPSGMDRFALAEVLEPVALQVAA